jgi:DNA-binding CsgD family transcriptional regulator/tetratricopeptide (TPR) repeat protein
LRHCVDGGVLEEDGDGGYWFHHPLQAEALEGSLEQQERQRLHAAYAGALEGDLSRSTAATGTPDLETLVLIADHHHRAGHTQESYLWSLRAADRAHAAGSDAEQVRLLRRALEVRERLDDSAAEPASALWERVRHAAETLGDHEEELAAVDALLAALDQDQDPLECAELLVRRQHLRFSTGKGFLDADELRRAVALAGREPESWQQAFALAELAHASLWQDDPRATQLAALSLEGARDCGHPRALAHALAANAMLAVFEGRVEEGRVLGAEAVAAAAQARDGWAFVHATLWEANAVGTPVSPTWAAVVSGRRAQLMSLALPQPFIAWLASDEGGARLYAGEWDACAQLLRTALGAKPGVLVDVKTRLNAARMAALQGRSREAEGHLARADELFAETSTFLALEFDTVRALVRLCAGDLRGTVDAALAGTATAGVPPTMCEWLLPLAARALADLGQGERDAGRDPGPVVAELDDLFRRFPRVIADMGGATDFYARELAGLQSLYEAEVARGRQSADAGARWADATRALHGVLPWEECYALWRQAEALLMGGLVGGSRQREPGVEALRRSHALARGLRAQPVLDELVSLARGARISLADPATTGPAPAARARAGLTARETEVLHHVVAGRSYGEIARALVVSEKTVSSHVSNLLRKTGCANRVDLARWATHPPAEHEA